MKRHRTEAPGTWPPATRKDLIPSEEAEQRALAQWLDLHRILWCHVPNGGQRSKAVAGKLKAAGVKAGVPDVLVFNQPRACSREHRTLTRTEKVAEQSTSREVCWENYTSMGKLPCDLDARGVAIELKRRKPAASRLSESQDEWAARLTAVGWVVRTCYGTDEAIALLQSLGFGKAR